LIISDNNLYSTNLYGTTTEGGAAGDGTVFRYNLTTTNFSVIYDLASDQGSFGRLVLCANELYGTAIYGGTNAYGSIFRVNAVDGSFTNLHIFSYTDGGIPKKGMILYNGKLYGTTTEGGDHNGGVIFQMNIDGSDYTILHNFNSDTDGAYPVDIIISGNVIYGTTANGGPGGHSSGTIFEITLPTLPALPALPALPVPVNVIEHHNHDSRDGLYIDSAFTPANANALRRDTSFYGTIVGNVYAQPLYIEGGPEGKAMIIVVTESDNVYALDAANGGIIWQTNVGVSVPLSNFSCGNIDPLGITGTPIVDLPSRTLFFDAMTTPDEGATKKHLIYALNVDTGTIKSGWPVDVNVAATSGTTAFNSAMQNQRGALIIVSNILYVPYGGFYGECGTYRGWVVGVSLSCPCNVMAWATTANGGGAWGVGGIASDGITPFISTGNSYGVNTWSGGEAVIRFQAGPIFSALSNDYWVPANWKTLDNDDLDLGGSGPLLVDVPGATPSQLVVALGKDGNAYLLDRNNLGGIGLPLAQAHVSSNPIFQAAATYRTTQGTYVVFSQGTQLSAFRINASSPPTITSVWTASQNGHSSPFVTSTGGSTNVIVWGIGSQGDQRLHGFDGDTGAIIFNGGGANELMMGAMRLNTAIAAHGRIYVANNNQVYAFTVPVLPIVLTNVVTLPGDGFQFGFTNTPGLNFSVFNTTNLAMPLTNWEKIGSAIEVSSGQFKFTDSSVTNNAKIYYRVTSP
jgi:uncharacterized repeat protein (TIGR03803 family)